jgi:hypothetical protein
MENDVTLAQALERVGIIYSHAELIESIKTEAELKVWLQEINAAVDGALHYYFVTGVASVARTVRTNIKSLLVFQKGILPATYNESEMRSRAYWGLNMTFLLQSLPTPVEQAIAQIQQKLGEAALQTPYLQSLQGDTKNRIIEILKASIQETAKGFESNPKRGLTLTRATISASLKRSSEVPFFLGKVNATQVDFEIAVVTLLANVSMNPTRSGTERIAAAGSLATYQGRTRLGDEFILVAIDCLKKERDTAETNDARETSSEILKKLSGT